MGKHHYNVFNNAINVTVYFSQDGLILMKGKIYTNLRAGKKKVINPWLRELQSIYRYL